MWNSEFLGVITARSGSKSIRDKNLQEISGKNLIEWSAGVLCKSKRIKKGIISTDSAHYATFAQNFGIGSPFIRPLELANDNSTDREVFQHLCNWLSERGQLPKYLVHLRPTTPIRDPQVIDFAIDTFLSFTTKITAMRSVQPMSESAYKCFEVNDEGKLISIFTKDTAIDASNNPKEGFPKTYLPNGYVDIIDTEHLQRTGRLHGDNVMAFFTENTPEIDSVYDLELARMMVEKNPNLHGRVFL
jgi:CMP-N,N'-diacetyllegionaminic acid synthase